MAHLRRAERPRECPLIGEYRKLSPDRQNDGNDTPNGHSAAPGKFLRSLVGPLAQPLGLQLLGFGEQHAAA